MSKTAPWEVFDTYQQMADAVDDPREGPDGFVDFKPTECRHEHSFTTMCGVTRCLICNEVVG